MVLVGVLVLEAVNVALLATQSIAADAALIAGVFLLFAPISTHVMMSRLGQGTAYLDSVGLTVRTRGVTHHYRWEDISSVEIRPFVKDGFLSQILGWVVGEDAKQPVVHMKLRRSLRLSLLGGRYGTSIAGIPSILFNTTGFYLEDPEGFARSANSLIQHKGQDGATALT